MTRQPTPTLQSILLPGGTPKGRPRFASSFAKTDRPPSFFAMPEQNAPFSSDSRRKGENTDQFGSIGSFRVVRDQAAERREWRRFKSTLGVGLIGDPPPDPPTLQSMRNLDQVRLFFCENRPTPPSFFAMPEQKRSLFPLVLGERAKIPANLARSGVSELSGVKLPREENEGALGRRLGRGLIGDPPSDPPTLQSILSGGHPQGEPGSPLLLRKQTDPPPFLRCLSKNAPLFLWFSRRKGENTDQFGSIGSVRFVRDQAAEQENGGALKSTLGAGPHR